MTSLSFAAPHYPWADALPDASHAIAVADGIRWLRLPLPFALDHINVWLLDDAQPDLPGSTLVDCGVGTHEVEDTWRSLEAAVLQDAPVRRIVVTHLHPDHVGMAERLARRWHAPVAMSAADFAWAHFLCRRPLAAARKQARAHYQRHGVPDEFLATLVDRGTQGYRRLVPSLPASYQRLREGGHLSIGQRNWELRVGYGHAPEHICLAHPGDGLLIAGDMVLPRISTNLSVGDIEPDANPIPDFLASLDALRDLPADTLVLPSHGKPFRGLHARIDALQAHHAERLQATQAACETARSAYEVMQILFKRPLDAHQLSFALGEALAHLHWAESTGKVRSLVRADRCWFVSHP